MDIIQQSNDQTTFLPYPLNETVPWKQWTLVESNGLTENNVITTIPTQQECIPTSKHCFIVDHSIVELFCQVFASLPFILRIEEKVLWGLKWPQSILRGLTTLYFIYPKERAT